MDIKSLTRSTAKTDKIWGAEHLIVNDEYCGKLLEIKKGWRTSIHSHYEKKETFFVLEGCVGILDGKGKSEIMFAGDILTIDRRRLHAICGIHDSVVLEISTHHNDQDSHRQDKSCKIKKEDIC